MVLTKVLNFYKDIDLYITSKYIEMYVMHGIQLYKCLDCNWVECIVSQAAPTVKFERCDWVLQRDVSWLMELDR